MNIKKNVFIHIYLCDVIVILDHFYCGLLTLTLTIKLYLFVESKTGIRFLVIHICHVIFRTCSYVLLFFRLLFFRSTCFITCCNKTIQAYSNPHTSNRFLNWITKRAFVIHCDSWPKFSSQSHHGDTGGVSSKYCKVAVSLTIVT